MNTGGNSPYIQFLNHSCIIISDGETSILCDPWFQGTAFDDGWRLILEDSHNINELQFDWIWLSHEHPDHFSVPTLSTLKTPTKFIYQQTVDRKVASYLRSKGHDVLEIESGREFYIGKLCLSVFTCDGYDSALLVRFPDGTTFLNVNDARLELGDLIAMIRQNCPDLDTMAIQFSYANWAGNDGDLEIARDQHLSVLERIQFIGTKLNPKQIMLFASFVYFSHEENFYWNKHFWLGDVATTLSESFKIIVPKPDQIISTKISSERDFSPLNKNSLAFWAENHSNVRPKDFSGKSLSLPELQQSYDRFHNQLWQVNNLSLARQSARPEFTLCVLLADQSCVVEIGLFERSFTRASSKEFDIKISSNTLDLLLRKPYARGTVSINSKIEFNYPTSYKFFVFFFLFYANNIGRYFGDGKLDWTELSSLKRVSVLQSIFKIYPASLNNFDHFLTEFVHPYNKRTAE